jgi:hypothetical protein
MPILYKKVSVFYHLFLGLALVSCSGGDASGPEDVDGTYNLVAIGGAATSTPGSVVLSAGGTFSRYISNQPGAPPINTGVFTVSGSTIRLDLTNEPELSLRSKTGTIKNGTLEYTPHYQSQVYRYVR